MINEIIVLPEYLGTHYALLCRQIYNLCDQENKFIKGPWRSHWILDNIVTASQELISERLSKFITLRPE